MRPTRLIGNLPRVGVEIEISRWSEQTGSDPTSMSWHDVRNDKAQALMDAGYMPQAGHTENFPYSHKFHTWNCKCFSCNAWESTDTDPYPVQFSLKYDGTLPVTGGEFISSPFSIDPANWESFYGGWKIISESAVADFKIVNKQGNPSSPSIHVHASCVNDDYERNVATQFRWAFAPEIAILSGATEMAPRPMQYRKLWPTLDHHHSFMNLKHMRAKDNSGKFVSKDGNYVYAGPHIELRTWEPDYIEDRYIEGAVHTTAAIAQVMSSSTFSRKLMGLSMVRHERNMDAYNGTMLENMTWDEVCDLVIPDVYRMLQHAILTVTYAANDDQAADAITWVFNEAAERWNIG